MQTNTSSLDFAGLEAALNGLDSTARELVLDFSCVDRIEAEELRQLEGLADAATAKAVAIVLRGVNVNVYKVLKLMRLTQRLSFSG